jgi:hypothetical protein
MIAVKNRHTFPIGLLLFVLMIAFYKAIRLSVSMMLDWRSFLFLAGLDLLYIALLLLLGIAHGFAGSRVLRRIFRALLVFLSVTYLIDSFVLLALNEHAPLFDIGRYALEPGVVLSFVDAKALVAILLLLISMFVVSTFSRAVKITSLLCLFAAILFGGFCSAYAPEPLARYAMLSPRGILESIKSRRPVSSYTAEQIEFYAGLDLEKAEIPVGKPDIVLVIVESLSSINSKKVSGNAGFLDGFDSLSDEGLLFRNFFANHQASEGGLIALLGGYPPMHFPNATPYMFDEFAIQPSVLDEYRQQGYYTEYLTNSDLSFIGMNHYLNGLGLDRSRGRDQVDAMRDARRVVQDAPSDAFLYSEALQTIQGLSPGKQPFLLTLATTSTHLPYTHPEQGEDTREAVWEWSMLQLNGFYQRLKESGYFEHGILLITGDHRQMQPLTNAETARYGDSARARVPLLVIGKDYPRGVSDERFFQQSDLLRRLGKIQQADFRLSPQPIWVERYNRKYGHIELIDYLSVFDQEDNGRHEYRLKVPGNRIEWQDEYPQFAREVETRIHAQRSLHQWIRDNKNNQAALSSTVKSGDVL